MDLREGGSAEINGPVKRAKPKSPVFPLPIEPFP